MALNRGNFVRNVSTVGTTPIEARLAQASAYAENAPGVPRSGVVWGAAANLVVPNGATMSFDISPFEVVISRAANEGVYVLTMTGATNLATTAAPGSGSRYDLVYVKQNDPDKGDANNAPVLGVVQGTSSTGTPTKPYGSVPAGGFVIAEARIFSGTTFASGGTNTMAQVFAWTTTRGGQIPVRDTTDRATITAPAVGQEVLRLDPANGPLVERWTGTAWINTLPVALVPLGSWTAISGDGAPKIWSPDGNTVHLTGAMIYNGGTGTICNIPTPYLPTSSTSPYKFIGTVLCSNGSGSVVGGPLIELHLLNGQLVIGYQTASVPTGSRIPMHGTYIIRDA